ncbi:MAG TPA: type II secretion system protein GspM [Allosphingosinicella sp.]
MSETVKLWWRTRSLREQRLLLVTFGLAIIVFAWLLVVRPMGDALSNARERHGEAVQALAEARANAALIANLQGAAPAATGGPLDMVVSNAAAEAGFPVNRVDRQGTNQATIVMDNVRPQAFFGWIGQMEAGRGLIVDRLAATANSDQTIAVEVTFRTRGG